MLWGFLLAWLLSRWGVACEPAAAPPLPLRFPGCEGLLMCPPRPSTGWEQSWASTQGTTSCFYGRPCCHQVPGPGWAPLCPAGAQSLPVVE